MLDNEEKFSGNRDVVLSIPCTEYMNHMHIFKSLIARIKKNQKRWGYVTRKGGLENLTLTENI